MFELAKACMQWGWVVFPVRDKKPMIRWKEGATNTWEAWPEDADVGLPTGARNGIVVIDDDREKVGLPAWEPPCDTYSVRTRSGGRHWYFRHPGRPVSNSAGRVAPHVDVRGDGGYVVVYELGDRIIVPLPEELVPERTKPKHAIYLPPADRAALSHMLLQTPPWAPGERNMTLFKMACIFLENNMDLAVLREKARLSGLDEHEVERTLTSVRARVVNS